ncbi:MAG: energy-coupling factor ABC transporter permease [Caldicoprobacterales bacterium]|jgi:cobalt/nickel transport system permease protein|nr:energy-coupling factor ABC transporter permease [Clostridiales bacterium]
MSHIHLPDGVISPVWWITAWIICITLLWLFARKLQGDELRRKTPIAGVIGALMLIFMSLPLGFIPVHLSLAVLSGILAGPGLGLIAAFAVNTVLALMGHGGFTTIGINTLLMGGEAVLGYYLFKAASGRIGAVISAITANIIALTLSTALMIVIVSSAAGLTQALPIHSHDDHGQAQHGQAHIDEGQYTEDKGSEQSIENVQFLSLAGWSAVTLVILAGIFIESLVTGLIVRFFSRVRPDLLDSAVKG